jgi:hypothetical protein
MLKGDGNTSKKYNNGKKTSKLLPRKFNLQVKMKLPPKKEIICRSRGQCRVQKPVSNES